MSEFVATSAGDILQKQLQAGGTVTLANIGYTESTTRAASANDRYVIFNTTDKALVAGKTTSFGDVVRMDLWTGAVARVSTDSAGRELSGGHNTALSISADGRYVLFHSAVNDIVANDFGGGADLYRKDMVTGAVVRVTETAAGVQANSDTTLYGGAYMTPDARYVTFWTNASNLVAGDTDGSYDLFRKDMTTGAIVRVTPPGTGFSDTRGGAISADGRYVVFETAIAIAPGDTNIRFDVYRADLQTGTIVRASVAADGTQYTDDSHVAQMSADGRYIVFKKDGSGAFGVSTELRKDMVTGAVYATSDTFAAPDDVRYVVKPQNDQTQNPWVVHDEKTGQDSAAFFFPVAVGSNKLFTFYSAPAAPLVSASGHEFLTYGNYPNGDVKAIDFTANVAVSRFVANVLRGYALPEAGLALERDLAAQVNSGALTPTNAIQQVVKAAAATTSVATLSYEFFTGKVPGDAGLDYLVAPNGPNANNINSAYYQNFSIENRYINFAVNLGKLGEGKDAFAVAYGAKTLFDTTAAAYLKIFGKAGSDPFLHSLLDTTLSVNGVAMTRAEYFAYYGGDGANGQGTKAAMVGWLLAEAVKADVGMYAKSNDAFLTDLADGATLGVDLVAVYGRPEYALT